MRVVAVIIVRGESQLLSYNLAFHADAGFDHFYVMSHNPDDATERVLTNWPEELITVVRHHADEFPQRDCQMRLIEMATERGFDWLFPLDADEFVYTGCPIREFLERLQSQGVQYAALRMFNMLHDVANARPLADPLDAEHGYYPIPERPWEGPASHYKSFCAFHPAIDVFPGGHWFPSLGDRPFVLPPDEAKLFHYSMKGSPGQLLRKWENLARSRLEQRSPKPEPWWEAYHLMMQRVREYQDDPERLLRDWFSHPRTFWGTALRPEQVIYDPRMRQWKASHLH